MKKSKKAYNGIYNRYIKRIFDILITGVALLILWPVYLFLGVAIFWKMGFQFSIEHQEVAIEIRHLKYVNLELW